MRISGTGIELSTSDLSQFLACGHLTALNLAVARGLRPPPSWKDPLLAVLQQRGLDHERYVDSLRADGLEATDLSSHFADDAVDRSLKAMQKGVDVLIQPALRYDRWFGRPDVLRRHEMPSAFGEWSYQVIDTKLANETRGGTILQLALYSELLRTQYRAARELLLARPPRLRTGAFQAIGDVEAVRFAVRIAAGLDHTVLAIQGPPGAGKTFTGAQMICELVRRGARVGVTAVSHKVICNLLNAVVKAADESQLKMNCAHKVTTKSDLPSNIDEITDNGDVITRLSDGQVHVVGGTQWLWARPDPPAIVDVLFVDEAGQMSLANVLAASQAAHSVVLLGDPQQLEQPQQGYHPIGTDVSALEHILQGHKTISSDRGIFLPETWRLAPSICAFTSEVFYEGRLHARAGLERQALVGTPPFEGAGLWVVPVAHDGNQNSSNEEAAIIERIVGGLVHPNARWTDRDGDTHAITPNDILIVAPYNSQVSLLAELLATRGVALARWINSRDRRRRWWSTRWRPPGRKTPRAGWSSYIASTG
jgi:hypothetical protein